MRIRRDKKRGKIYVKEEKNMFCANCGKKLEDGWKICPSCGRKIESGEYNKTQEHNETQVKEEFEQESVPENLNVPRNSNHKKIGSQLEF